MKLVVFDWDGTLVDSTARISACFEHAAAELGLPPCPHAREVIGLSLLRAVKVLYPDLDSATQTEFVHAYRRWFVSDIPSSRPFPAVVRTLEVLKERGHWMAVATGKSRRGLDRELQAFELSAFFYATRCADEAPSKPHPQMLHDILEELGLQADQGLMVGDTTYDLEMASAAGMGAVAALYGAHEATRLLQFDLLGAVSDIGDLPDLLPH